MILPDLIKTLHLKPVLYAGCTGLVTTYQLFHWHSYNPILLNWYNSGTIQKVNLFICY